MNLEYWNTLPPEIQGAVLRAAREAQEWCFSNARRYDMQTKPVLQKLGVTFYSLNEKEMEKWKEAALTAWPKLKSQCDQEVLNLLLEAQHKEFPR
jgi:TRAP-type C4-dicarboxylate transport system substrate-binding protein